LSGSAAYAKIKTINAHDMAFLMNVNEFSKKERNSRITLIKTSGKEKYN
jgi:hypothetical protein